MHISKDLDRADHYTVGKTIVSVNRVFRASNAGTLDERILNLMKRERKNPLEYRGSA